MRLQEGRLKRMRFAQIDAGLPGLFEPRGLLAVCAWRTPVGERLRHVDPGERGPGRPLRVERRDGRGQGNAVTQAPHRESEAVDRLLQQGTGAGLELRRGGPTQSAAGLGDPLGNGVARFAGLLLLAPVHPLTLHAELDAVQQGARDAILVASHRAVVATAFRDRVPGIAAGTLVHCGYQLEAGGNLDGAVGANDPHVASSSG